MPDYQLSLDEQNCLVVTTARPARVVFQYKFADEGGMYYLEPVEDQPHTNRLGPKFMDKVRAVVADPKTGTVSVLLEYGGFARAAVPMADLRAVFKV